MNLNNLTENFKENLAKNGDINEEKILCFFINFGEHLKAFNLLNDIYFHKFGNKEKDYNSLRTELKLISDNIERNIKLHKDKEIESSMKGDFTLMQRKLNTFRNVSSFEDVVYESINL